MSKNHHKRFRRDLLKKTLQNYKKFAATSTEMVRCRPVDCPLRIYLHSISHPREIETKERKQARKKSDMTKLLATDQRLFILWKDTRSRVEIDSRFPGIFFTIKRRR